MEYNEIKKLTDESIITFNDAHAMFGKSAAQSDNFFENLSKQLIKLQKHFSKHQLTILISGEVSSGKSTFVNSLIGKPLLPTAQETCTNVATKIVYGEDKVLVHFKPDENGVNVEPKEISMDEVSNYATETLNPKNLLNVEYIEIFTESPLLEKGLTFIDTPGLGAIDPLHAIATFNVATQADLIFFLGSVLKPLTTSEVLCLKDLTTVVSNPQVLHIVSRADQGDKDIILNKNIEIIKTELPTLNFKSVAVSSAKYNKYHRTGNKFDLEDSGFQYILSYIDELNASLIDQLNDRFATLAATTIYIGYSNLKEKINIIENPSIKAAKVDQLNGLLKRLDDIKTNINNWRISLTSNQKKLCIALDAFCEDERRKIESNLDTRLNRSDDFYLHKSKKEALCNTIAADLTAFQTNLGRKIESDYYALYEQLRNDTGLKKIQEESIDLPKKTDPNISVRDDLGQIHIGDVMMDAYRATMIGIGSGVLTTGVASLTSAAGAKIGFLLGMPIPVIGPVTGACIGAIVGLLAGVTAFFAGRDARRNRKIAEISNACKQQIRNVFTDVKRQLQLSEAGNAAKLMSIFENELNTTIQDINSKIKNINAELTVVTANFKKVKDMAETCKKTSLSLNSSLESHEA